MKTILVRLLLIAGAALAYGCHSTSCPDLGFGQGDRFQVTVLSLASSNRTCPSSLTAGESFTLTAGPAVQGPPGGDGQQACTTYGAAAAAPPFATDFLTSCTELNAELGLSCTGMDSGCPVSATMSLVTTIGPGVATVDGLFAINWQPQGCGLDDCAQQYNVRIDRLAGSDAGALQDGASDSL
jgi:hypothetical protein